MTEIDHLLDCLIEECSEIIKEVCKAKRFGLDDHAPDDPTTNGERIVLELGDLHAVCDLLRERGALPLISFERSQALMRNKKKKLAEWMDYSRARGRLE